MNSDTIRQGVSSRLSNTFLSLLPLSLLLLALTVPPADAKQNVGTVEGDQILFFFDGRQERVPFFSIANPAPLEPVRLEIVFYPRSLDRRLGAVTLELPALGHRILDPRLFDGGVAIGEVGLAAITPIDAQGRPVVPPAPLVGTFTLANLPLESAFGGNPIGRRALRAGAAAPAGRVVDGSSILYERIAPIGISVPVFYNPQELGPVNQDGNRVVLVAFEDGYGDRFDLKPLQKTMPTYIFGASGQVLASLSSNVEGVTITNLQEIAAPTVLEASGKVIFDVDNERGNVFGLFAQSLGPFGAYQPMPGLLEDNSLRVAIDDPKTAGDQLFFFFDDRSTRVPFFSIANPSREESVRVEVVFYPESLDAPLGDTTIVLPKMGNVIVNPSKIAGGIGKDRVGLAVVTPIGLTNRRPIVPPLPLTGGSTLANVPLRSAFGDNPTGRFAVTPEGKRPDPGTPVDGGAVSYQKITPQVLMVPVFYNPEDLGPVSEDGNRIILAAFKDRYGDRFSLEPSTKNMRTLMYNASGGLMVNTQVKVEGLLLSNLQEIAMPAELKSSGKVFFEIPERDANVFGIYTQSLGPFGAGQPMPAPHLNCVEPLPSPTPSP